MNKNLLEKKNLIARLAGYAASTGALMAFGANANGQVYSGDQNILVNDPADPYELDIDGDGTTDFTLGLILQGPAYPSYNSAFIEQNGTVSYQNSWLGTSSGNVFNLSDGSPIDAGQSSWNNSGDDWNLGSFYFPANSPRGPFPGQGDQFLGVRFNIGTDMHYGWIRMNIPDSCNQIHILDWGYQLEPEAGILAGEFDNTPPVATIDPGVVYMTNVRTLTVDVTFDEPVIGLQLSDFSISNGFIQNLTVVTPGIAYTLEAIATVHGQVVLSLPAGAVTDSSLVDNELTSRSWFWDNHPPTLTYDLGFTGPTNDPTKTITVTFSEEILDLYLADFQVTNGTASNLVQVTANKVYTIDIAATAAGLVTVNLPASAVLDYGSNPNAATAVSWTYDNIKPVATLTPSETGYSNALTMLVTVSFSEEIQGLAISDFVITNGTAANLTEVTAGEEYTVEVTASAEGIVGIDLPADAVTDLSGNGNVLVSANWTYDGTAPVATVDAGLSTPTANQMVVVTLSFDEEIQGLAITDLVITNGTAANLNVVSAGLEYTVEITAITEGEVIVELPTDAITDLAGNPNASSSESWLYDISGPQASFTMGATNVALVVVTVNFDEEVEGLELVDFVVTNGTAANLVEVTPGLEYTIEVTAAAVGEVTLELQAGTINDLAGNENDVASVNWLFDSVAPVATLDAGLSGPTSAPTIAVTITFNEEIQGLELTDLVVTNGTAANLIEQTVGIEYSVEITATANGPVTIEVPAAAVTDIAGNENASASTSWIFDSSAPSVTLDAGVSGTTTDQTVTISVIMSEVVEGLTLGDFIIINGTASNLVEETAGEQYSIDVTATAGGDVTITLPAGAVADLAGNENAPVSIAYTYDDGVGLNGLTDVTVRFFPNPASDHMFIEVANEAKVTITYLSGQVALVRENVSKERIDLSGLPKGIYLMHVQTDLGTSVHKFVIE
jgi:hypothetical protein